MRPGGAAFDLYKKKATKKSALCAIARGIYLCNPIVGERGTFAMFLKATPRCFPFFLRNKENCEVYSR